MSAPSQTGGDDAEEARVIAGVQILEVMRQVGVEGDRVARFEAVFLPGDLQSDSAFGDDCGLATARLVHGRVAGPTRARMRLERVDGDLRSLPGQRRGEDLIGVDLRATGPTLPLADDRHALALVQAEELAEAQVETARDTTGYGERGAGISALDLR